MTLPSGTALKEKDVIKMRRIFENYRESGALNALVNIHAAAAESIFLTKSGDLVSFLAVNGRDYECLDAFQLNAVARGFESAVQHFDSKFTVYQYLLKNDHPLSVPANHTDPLVPAKWRPPLQSQTSHGRLMIGFFSNAALRRFALLEFDGSR
jgi:type IV secretory pathway VirB4 component